MVLYIQTHNDQGTLLRLRIGLVKIKKEMSTPARSNLLREHRAIPSRAFEGGLFKANAERGATHLYVSDLEGCFAAFLGCT
jgi:hypothetical protein